MQLHDYITHTLHNRHPREFFSDNFTLIQLINTYWYPTIYQAPFQTLGIEEKYWDSKSLFSQKLYSRLGSKTLSTNKFGKYIRGRAAEIVNEVDIERGGFCLEQLGEFSVYCKFISRGKGRWKKMEGRVDNGQIFDTSVQRLTFISGNWTASWLGKWYTAKHYWDFTSSWWSRIYNGANLPCDFPQPPSAAQGHKHGYENSYQILPHLHKLG